VAITLGLQPFLPAAYVPDLRLRMELYRRINRCEKFEDLAEIERELRDRFGPVPQEALNLLTEARLRILAEAAFITSLALSGRVVIVGSRNLPATRTVLARNGNVVRVVDDKTLHLLLFRHIRTSEQVAQFLEKSLKP